jgi:hypothetical protein
MKGLFDEKLKKASPTTGLATRMEVYIIAELAESHALWSNIREFPDAR